MSETLKVGIVGCGVIAPYHMDSYINLPDVELVGICDKEPAQRDHLLEVYSDLKAEGYGSLGEMLKASHIDAVSICTDHASHEALVLEALQAGVHVICEKPLTTSVASMERLLQAAEASSCVTAGILQHRFDPIYIEVRRLIQAGVLGPLQSASCQHACLRPPSYYEGNWRGSWAGEGGSLLINQSIHFLDIIQWIGGGVSELKGILVNDQHREMIETEDGASLSFKFNSGGLGSYIASTATFWNWSSRFQFVGTKGAIYLEGGAMTEVHHADDQTASEIMETLGNLENAARLPGAKAYYGSSHPAQIADFVAAIREGRSPLVTFKEAGEALRLILELYTEEGSSLIS